jgi:[acyl-carrier-protein] S-malonyltransferase
MSQSQAWGALFPGQGSQSIGMGKFLFEEFQTARLLFEEASERLKTDMKKLCFEGPEADLQLTENTQPALLLVSTATQRVIHEVMDLKISASCGHSVGEYAALVHAGVLPFSDAIAAVRERGRAMQRAVPVGEGAMCAVLGMADEMVRRLCKEVETVSGERPLEPANFNCPGQVVVSGSAKAVDWMRANAKSEWIAEKLGPEAGKPKFIPLSVSAPFHCQLMKPAEVDMRSVLEKITFSTPKFAVVQNLNAKSSNDANEIRERLIGQISGAVLWTQCQEEMLHRGIAKYVECGSGKVLQGLAKKIAGERAQVFGLNSIADLKALETALT